MKYYIIVGEASGDLHASNLMLEIKRQDSQAEFRFFGGNYMASVGGTCVRNYDDMAYMGFMPVLLHLPTILWNMRLCKKDIVDYAPHALILVDYPGFNLKIAKFIKSKTKIPVFYYISPKIWAWKEHRIRNIKRDVDELFSILPFEVPFFEQKHNYPVHYVGNPTVQEVRDFRRSYCETKYEFLERNRLNPDKPVLALLCGSRRQEIRDNLPKMIEAAQRVAGRHQLVIAGVPSLEPEFYESFTSGKDVKIVYGQTYKLLSVAHTALVTSGTATLETALFRVPQVVCYETGLHFIVGLLRRQFLKVPYVSLVNLIANREVVPELIANDYTVDNICSKLEPLLSDTPERESQLSGYQEVCSKLGEQNAPKTAAKIMIEKIKNFYFYI